jgi:hypothetical protein
MRLVPVAFATSKAAGAGPPPSRSRTGPASPWRSVRAPGQTLLSWYRGPPHARRRIMWPIQWYRTYRERRGHGGAAGSVPAPRPSRPRRVLPKRELLEDRTRAGTSSPGGRWRARAARVILRQRPPLTDGAPGANPEAPAGWTCAASRARRSKRPPGAWASRNARRTTIGLTPGPGGAANWIGPATAARNGTAYPPRPRKLAGLAAGFRIV